MSNKGGRPEITFNVKSGNPTTDIFGGDERRRSGSDTIAFTPIKDRISAEQFAKMAAQYVEVCVNDYGDTYHLSDEEKYKISQYHDLFTRLNRLKRKHKKLNEFVKVYRQAMECLNAVAKDNGIYKPKAFKKMVLTGKLKVTGLFFPTYIGKNRKSINWDYVADYIYDTTLDPDDLAPRDEVEIEMSDDFNRYFTDEEFERILQEIKEYDKLPEVSCDDDPPDIYAVVDSKKESKKYANDNPEVIRAIRNADKLSRKRRRIEERTNGVYLYEMTESEFDEVSKMDERRGLTSSSDIPKFKGDIMNKDDYNRYMHELEIYEEENCIVNHKGKMMTVEDANLDDILDAFSAGGVNVRALYKTSKKDKKKLKKIKKEDDRKLRKLKAKMIEITDRNKKLGKKYGIEFDVKKDKRQKKADKKKAKKKKKEDD